MLSEDTLFHIEWGDGDHVFIIAPTKEEAIGRITDGKDMIRSVVELKHLYNLIYQAGVADTQRGIGEWLERKYHYKAHLIGTAESPPPSGGRYDVKVADKDIEALKSGTWKGEARTKSEEASNGKD